MYALLILFLALDIASIKNEPNPERRSERAIENADSAFDAARQAYGGGDVDKTRAHLDELRESVDLAYQSLGESGKDPRKSSKFKHAELKTRELVRRLDGLARAASVEDRVFVEKIRDRVAEVHDNLLKDI